ncbi:MAG: hypothetical protein E7643_05395 [Ruminococcaceae bacterium]|nr:hypothetical protein [Oscillospiraceae bacterium]
MKRRSKKALFALFLILFSLLFSLTSHAKEREEITADTDTLPPSYTDLTDTLPEEIRDLLPDGIFSDQSSEVEDSAMEAGSFSYLLETVLSLLGLKLGTCLRLLCSVTGILILSALCKAMGSSLRSEGVSRAFSLCTTLVLLLSLLLRGYESIANVKAYFSTLGSISATSVPLLGALYAMGGNVSTAVASSAGLTVFMSLMEGAVGQTVVPFCGICLSLSLVGALDPSLRTGTLLSTVKKNYTTVLTFLMMLLLTMLSSQTLLASRSDTLAMKSAKFAMSNVIPVLGGSASELLKTVGVGISYLRGTVGVSAVLLLLFLLLPTLIELLLLRLSWQIGASLADLLGCDREKRLLDEFASLHGYLIAAVCICSSILFISFTLLIHCASAVG